MLRSRWLVNLFIGITAMVLVISCQSNSNQISFNNQVRPILNKHCVSCHGGVKQQGDLNLLFEHTAKAPAKSGNKAIVDGSLSQSELYNRITHNDPELRMPLEKAPLSEDEISILEKWIKQGADWEKHWAYVSPELPTIPKTSDWASHDIDAFVKRKLDQLELSPNDPAKAESLLARIAQDLTGLPPTLEEQDQFLNDKALDIESVTAHYLASPHFGEKWAMMWLDLARFADSHGFEKDHHREISKYRDWVIKAFNEDKPFDEFTLEQLAGDLLEDPTVDQLIATGFHRNTMVNSEGGVRNEEYRIAAVMDRVNTTWEVWSSTSMSCAQCHGHPYDPFTHKDYYQQLAFFNNTRDEDIGDDSPNLFFYDDIQESKIDSIKYWISNYTKPSTASDVEKLLRIAEPKVWSYKAEVIRKTATVGDDYLLQGRDDGIAVFRDFPFGNNTHMLVSFSSSTDDGIITVYTDSLLQNQVGEWSLGKSGGNTLEIFEIEPVSGLAELYLHFSSNSAKRNKTDAVANVSWLLPSSAIGVLNNNENKIAKTFFINLLQNPKDKAPIMVENDGLFRRNTHVFSRGSWLTPLEKVEAGIPASISSNDLNISKNRLGLANWLVDGNHPMTSRVFVNRIWEQLFGSGLVSTLEDFGTQGEEPTHPELLNYLAVQFQTDMNWSLKTLLQEIISSSTYRQSSKSSSEKMSIDPYNAYLSRGPRFRISAEQIRDKALAVSGLLNKKIGGPSVMPYLPPAAWNPVYPQYTRVHWETSKGDDKYRRGLYTYNKRTNPYPANATFDMQTRDVCVSRRIRTNTPLQALNMLNDPVFVEAANAFGSEMEEVKTAAEAKNAIAYGYKKALSKNPDNETLDLLLQLHSELEQEQIQANKIQTVQPDYAEMGFESPMAVIANTILNLDAFVVKE